MILGVTGGFGCGKSSVLQFFRSRNWFVLDADAVCRKFYDDRNPTLLKCIRDHFGEEMFLPDGSVNRQKLAELLFNDSEKMKIITGVIYPLLQKEIKEAINWCRQQKRNAAFELPLLYECGYEKQFDAVLAIWCDPQLRKKRLAGRGFSPDEMARRDKMQLPPEEKLQRADFGVINNGSLKNLQDQLTSLIGTIEKDY